MIWLITDTHFGHEKLLEFCGRPAGFEAKIFKGLKPIMPGDVLIHLGDFCIGDDKKWHDAWFTHLPEVKRVLVRGNHDRKSDSWYYDHGWHVVCENLTIMFEGKKILFSHIPLMDYGQYDLNIHGHFHNSDHRSHEPELVEIKNDKQRLLAIEHTNYQPVSLRSFIHG